jgi:cytoskeletal protein CcmA (bactofilin family)
VTPSGSSPLPNRPASERGAILATALAILSVLMIVFLAAMTYCLSRYGQHIKDKNRLVAAFLADAGIQRTISQLTDSSLFLAGCRVKAPNGGTFQAGTMAWGPYVLVRAEGTFANQTVRATALVGSSPPEYFGSAITVCDIDYPFVVAGNTTIKGDVNTGPLGMTTGRIRGEGIVNENFHSGALNILEALPVLQLDSAVLARYVADMQSRRLATSTVYGATQVWRSVDQVGDDRDQAMIIENNLRIESGRHASPSHITSLFVNGYTELVGSTRLSGLVEIISVGPIYVSDSAVVDGAILCSEDSIVISDCATFSGIAMSSRRIIVKDKAGLSYPALLLLTPGAGSNGDSCGIWVTSRGALEAVCFLHFQKANERNEDCQVYLDTAVTFTGAIVSEGKADLRGAVRGTIVTRQFCYTEPTTNYINWVKDLHVSRPLLTFLPTPPILQYGGLQAKHRIVRMDVTR